MSGNSSIRCATPRCVSDLAQYGERYHGVYDLAPESPRYPGTGAVAFCERCGGYTTDGAAWVHRCKKCKTEVEPGGLRGLFVPHSCPACEKKAAEADVARGAVCGRCRQAFSRCCC